MSQFLQDVLKGLTAAPKFLESKYFYNEQGDKLFEDLMKNADYYLTSCEGEIFEKQSKTMGKSIIGEMTEFDLVELGAGDATKSICLFEELLLQKASFTYYPIDISRNVISFLEKELPIKMPGFKVHGLAGEYLEMLASPALQSSRSKVVLFLGSNIGNFPPDHTNEFVKRLRAELKSGDLILIGFDLKKDAQTILNAYNDKAGITSQFNLNLLQRINDELHGNFVPEQFEHFPVYDPQTGSCKSFLVSKTDQAVEIDNHHFFFEKHESIFMEISQKYTVKQVEEIARATGFTPLKHFFDSKEWFVDSLWKAV
ncbi:MAG: L-histidine N(alpha)-methyltransferase [Chitinophagaceae bacterium]